jgi:hypothetical protein
LSTVQTSRRTIVDAKPGIAIAAAVGVTLMAWFAVVLVYRETFHGPFSTKPEEWGQFGDYIGGLLNPLLGTLTLIGVLYTVMLQRDVLAVTRHQLADARRTTWNQRLLSEQQAFETGFFHLLEAVDQHARSSFIWLAPKDFEPVSALPRIHADSISQRFAGESVFASAVRAFRGRFMKAFDRGDFTDRQRGEYLRSQAAPFFVAHDKGLGPFLRAAADLFEYVEDHDIRLKETMIGGSHAFGTTLPITEMPAVQGPAFYARVAANNRTRVEMKVLAMYVASDLASDRLRKIATKYSIFDPIVDAAWWGRGPFIQMRDFTDDASLHEDDE